VTSIPTQLNPAIFPARSSLLLIKSSPNFISPSFFTACIVMTPSDVFPLYTLPACSIKFGISSLCTPFAKFMPISSSMEYPMKFWKLLLHKVKLPRRSSSKYPIIPVSRIDWYFCSLKRRASSAAFLPVMSCTMVSNSIIRPESSFTDLTFCSIHNIFPDFVITGSSRTVSSILFFSCLL